MALSEKVLERSVNGNGGWWKGSFPTWIVAGLIALLGFFLQREIKLNDTYRDKTSAAMLDMKIQITNLDVRIGILEQTVRENHILLTDIRKQIKY